MHTHVTEESFSDIIKSFVGYKIDPNQFGKEVYRELESIKKVMRPAIDHCNQCKSAYESQVQRLSYIEADRLATRNPKRYNFQKLYTIQKKFHDVLEILVQQPQEQE